MSLEEMIKFIMQTLLYIHAHGSDDQEGWMPLSGPCLDTMKKVDKERSKTVSIPRGRNLGIVYQYTEKGPRSMLFKRLAGRSGLGLRDRYLWHQDSTKFRISLASSYLPNASYIVTIWRMLSCVSGCCCFITPRLGLIVGRSKASASSHRP